MVRLLYVKLNEVHAFKGTMEVLHGVIPEANWEFKRTETEKEDSKKGSKKRGKKAGKKEEPKTTIGGMKIMAVDATKSILVYLKLDANKFAEFQCAVPRLLIGVNMVKFFRMIKGMDKGDSLTMYVESETPDTLFLELESSKDSKKTGPSSNITLSLLDLDEDPYQIPPTDFESRVTMSLSDFSKNCKDLQAIDNLVDIQCTHGNLMLRSKDNGDIKEVKFPYDPSDEESPVMIEFSDKADTKIVQGIFELKHLVSFSKCVSFCLDIEIFMKNNYPLVIRFMVASLGRLYLCLTPIRIKNADDDDDDEEDEFEDEDEYYDEEEVIEIA